ncbi:polysaccharide biosynthesis tyrosine autokinase [Halocola ammonii]
MAPNRKNNFFDPEDLVPVFKFIGKNWYLMVILPAIFFGAAYLYTMRLPDVYAAKTEILLKSDDTYDYQSQIYSRLGYMQAYADVTNQKRILSSYDMIEDVLQKLDFEVSYHLVGRWTTTQVTGFKPFQVEADPNKMTPALHNRPIDIKILNENTYRLDYELNGVSHEDPHKFGEFVQTAHYTIKLIKNPLFNDEMMRNQKERVFRIQIHPLNYLVGKYKRSLNINNLEFTSILTLTAEDQLASNAKTFLDTLTDTYIDYSLESQIRISKNTEEYINRQLNELESIMDSLEQEMQTYRDRNQILDLTREQDESFMALTNFEQEKRQLQLTLESVNSLEEYLYQSSGKDISLPPNALILGEDEMLSDQLATLYRKQIEREQLLIDNKEANLTVQKADSTINRIKASILRYTQDSRKALKSRISDIDKQIDQLEYELRNVPKSQRDIIGIERKMTVNEGLLEFLLEKKANTVIARAAIIPQTSIIETARSQGRIGPNTSRTHYLALGGGFFIALLIGLIRVFFFERIENTRDLKRLSSIPVIGGIPHYKEIDEEPLVVLSDPRSAITESFRTIRTNLQYMLTGDEKNKIILITSLHPGEGKTFTSTNLATILARAGKKVLMLDFDLHKPRAHKVFEMENKGGITAYLSGRKEYREAIKKTTIENLNFLNAGPVPPNASELVLNDKVREMLSELKNEYDYLIIDTPPAMMISDAYVLLKYADTGIFVLNTLKATKQGVNFLEETLEQNNLEHVSLALNNLRQKRWKYYYQKYAYKYGYGYGYGFNYGYGYGGGPEMYGDSAEEEGKK